MNCEKCRRILLLAEAGEAGAARLRRARKHTETCAACRRFSESYRLLADGMAAAQPAVPPTPGPVMNRILEEAERRRSARSWMFPLLPRPALAAAATLAALAAAWMLFPARPRVPIASRGPESVPEAVVLWHDDVDAEFMELQWWLARAAGSLDANAAEGLSTGSDLDGLADVLLLLEES